VLLLILRGISDGDKGGFLRLHGHDMVTEVTMPGNTSKISRNTSTALLGRFAYNPVVA
jgi:hypothetical protein